MKLSAIRSNNIEEKGTINKNNTAFKGGVNGLVNFWQFVDNGGRAMQFTIEDMFGTNFPRTYKGAMAGYKYTGKINIPALLQEAIREFLTGPTMCITPVAILALAKKAGKTVNTHTENIINLSYLMKQATKNKAEITEQDFIKTVVEDFIRNTSGSAKETDITSVMDAFKEYRQAAEVLNNKETLKQIGKKQAKQKLSEALKNLEQEFESIVKRTKESYINTDFTQVKYSINNSKQGSTSFKNYIEYINAYIQDFTKKFSKDGVLNAIDENITSFKNSFLGKRILTFISMFAITGFLMSFIPKIYTKASGGINPNATAIYKEAGKNQKKGDVNNDNNK